MHTRILSVMLLLATLAGCTTTTRPTPSAQPSAQATIASPTRPAAGVELRVMTHDSFAISPEIIAAFEQQHNAKVTLLPSGDAGSALNKAILSKDAPLADIFFGVDNTFLSRALAAGIFEPYQTPALASIPAEFQLDTTGQLVPIDYGYVTINYDKRWLTTNGKTPPTDLKALTTPEWKGTLVVENPATSSPGLAFLLATIATFGDQGTYTWRDYWRDLRANDVLVAEGWNDAYYTHFSGSSGQGPRPLVVSYATSPAAEVFFSEGKLTEPPTGNLAIGSFRQIEYAGILAGTRQRALAEQFIDYMLSKPFQEDIPLNMFVYPVLPDASLPEVFTRYAEQPANPATLDPALVEQNRETWLKEWEQIVVR